MGLTYQTSTQNLRPTSIQIPEPRARQVCKGKVNKFPSQQGLRNLKTQLWPLNQSTNPMTSQLRIRLSSALQEATYQTKETQTTTQ